MLFEAANCSETVSILHAIVFGAGDACLDIGLASLLGGIAAFVACVVVLRYVGARILRRILPSRRDATVEPTPAEAPDPGLKQRPYESPIQSTGAWGNKPR